MTITLTEPFRALAERQAADAGFTDVGSYLESLIERAAVQAEDRAQTVAAVREGLADVAAGRTRPADEVLAAIARKFNIPLTENG